MKDEIICLLDVSGSMQSCADDAKGGFNTFLDEQLVINEANITVLHFDDTFSVNYEGLLSKCPKLNAWPCRGMTALYDAIGKTFTHVCDRFTKEQPQNVIFAILTDGHENASKEYTSAAVKELVEEHQEKYGWNIIFLAADQDAWATGSQMGILKQNAVDYSSKDTRKGFRNYTNTVTGFRS